MRHYHIGGCPREIGLKAAPVLRLRAAYFFILEQRAIIETIKNGTRPFGPAPPYSK